MRYRILIVLFYAFTLAGVAQQTDMPLVYTVQQPVQPKQNLPILFYLHGYGANENDLAGLLVDPKDKFITVSVRAPFKKDAGFSWFDVQFAQDHNLIYSYDQVEKSKAMLLEFISKVCRKYKADSTRVYVLGFSQGAIMAYELALSAPTKIAGIMALSGRMLPETAKAERDWKTVSQVKIFIAHGKSDDVIKYADSERAYEFLKSKQVKDLTFKYYQMPHTISGIEVADVESWLRKFSAQERKK